MEGDFLSVKQVATTLDVSIHKVLKLINAGIISASDVGSPGTTRPHWRIEKKDLRNFLNRTSNKKSKADKADQATATDIGNPATTEGAL
jgi:excisionase family DNA binding protein